ncbi:PREDICTED: disrupted in schizophrenia 1 protein isoform X1 [Thamnophis sirtalis]|uniref:Disrupted in schizophrenia 1 protein isoform X1 n=1 Tax=Thamnophis sirtalis TaxID=35019 RepID=A0A6I9YAF6_9SAUR|nr:PREDICTED: disrupted in schizophrenia 1 protein isoform X1 [Thamnophis sirtalis]
MSQTHATILSNSPAINNHKGYVSSAQSLPAWSGKLLDAVEKTSEGVSSQKKERLYAHHQEKGINTQEPENKETSNGPSSLQDSFHSHFSFIQLSLNLASEAAAGESGSRESKEIVQLGGIEKTENINFHLSGEAQRISRMEVWASRNSLCDEVGTCPSEAAEDDILQDCGRLSPFHANNAFSSSMDSLEATSADSLVTSGYESCGIASDHSWDFLMKDYEPVVQECLLGNRRLVKIKSLIRKLQKLQEKAVAEDDYEKADKFRRRLEELHKEKSLLNFQLPSQHPSVSSFLDKFRVYVQMTLYEGVHKERNLLLEKSDQKILSHSYHEKIQIPGTKRDQLFEEKKWIQKEIEVLRAKLVVLEAKDQQLRIEIQEQDCHVQEQVYELSTLLSCVSLKELQTIDKILADILVASHEIPYRLDFPESVKRLQEKIQSLNISMTETAAEVCTNQRLCSTLRKKVSHIEIQLPALLETKMLAASGGNFSTDKDLAEKIQSLTAERDHLKGLLNEWSTLNAKNIQKLERAKERYKRLKEEMEQEEFVFEKKLKKTTLKYMEVLEDKLQSCGRSHLLERVCEVDLEACQLLIHGFLLNKNGSYVSEGEESQTEETKDMEDAFLTSKWEQSNCFSVNSSKQKSFRHPLIGKKHQSMPCKLKEEFDMLSTEFREKCERISKKLVFLEEQLQLAARSYDENLVQSLQREIQMVKETLQAMLVQLQSTKEAEEDAANFLGDSWRLGKESLKEYHTGRRKEDL